MLAKQLRVIKLAELLIDVNNDLQYLAYFSAPTQSFQTVEDKCVLLAAIMAHGCNICPSTKARLTNDITYRQIKQVTDWIEEEWDRMGQFYASLEKGHVTASTALKRLVGFSHQNHFY
jgi:hypothetical protein